MFEEVLLDPKTTIETRVENSEYWNGWFAVSVVWLILCLIGAGVWEKPVVNVKPTKPLLPVADKPMESMTVRHDTMMDEKNSLLSPHAETHGSPRSNQIEIENPIGGPPYLVSKGQSYRRLQR
jgi:hypothetical protein